MLMRIQAGDPVARYFGLKRGQVSLMSTNTCSSGKDHPPVGNRRPLHLVSSGLLSGLYQTCSVVACAQRRTLGCARE
uniref:Uncharacterized protein n=1 Tax=Timema shepardi TaxID=629360 RepID=A0A7R9B5B2_TIMSH|nr:unnamed protein product [Timema shepardi]